MKTTLNDLKEINLNAKKPPENMTNAEWQDYFARMKMMIPTAKTRNMKGVSPIHPKAGGEYYGETTAMRYQQFINGILKTIRSEEPDYAFYIYQISDLLKYEPNLKAKWLPESECFKLSL